MALALVRSTSALGALARVGDAVGQGRARLRSVVDLATPAAPGARERVVETLARARAVGDASEARARANAIASLRLKVRVLEEAAGAMTSGDEVARTEFAVAHASFRRAKSAWAAAGAPLVAAIARRYRRPGVDTSDLIQDGSIGLVRAVERFDPALGHRFQAFAAWWIRQHIFRGLERARSIRVPPPIVEASRRVGRARRVFEATRGDPPSSQQLEAVTGLDAKTIAAADAIAAPPLSLSFRGEGSERDLLERLADPSARAPDEEVAMTRFHERFRTVFEALAPCEREVLTLRFGLAGLREHTVAEVAAQIGVSRLRARRLEERAISKLREGSRRAGLAAYVAA